MADRPMFSDIYMGAIEGYRCRPMSHLQQACLFASKHVILYDLDAKCLQWAGMYCLNCLALVFPCCTSSSGQCVYVTVLRREY